ncbi:hypothetical protein [Nocardia terpenica]|uniref:Uncharacterized protein n=1 Tax=Nocardia terpenica TaxID=455432 RepID=A0A6G9YXW7_9NOCA|nr:hypothetical protein [Nocardia terpenica]QIS18042.1 hypothetical protein F6W96_06745 [Nocardia terpenica]
MAVVIAPVDTTVAVYSTRDPSPGGSAAISGRDVPGAAHQPIAAVSNSTARTMRAAWRCTAVLSGINAGVTWQYSMNSGVHIPE